MQEFSVSPITGPYGLGMQTGRPSKHPRTPFGERLHAAREAAGLSQAQVAEKMGVAQNAYAMWERHPVALKPQQIEKLAVIVGVSVDFFFNKATSRRQRGGPVGKARRIFEAVSKLPRHQQEKVIAILEPFVREHVSANGSSKG
jgi:transcriptional regulator with XRE-family HTH domain